MKNGIEVTETLKKNMAFRLCPDIDEDYNYYRVMNSYTNYTHRESFAVNILRCNSDLPNTDCKGDGDIRTFFNHFYFTSFIIHDKIQFTQNGKQGAPILSQDIFKLQFQASLDKYVDNNNFIR